MFTIVFTIFSSKNDSKRHSNNLLDDILEKAQKWKLYQGDIKSRN